MHSPVEAAIGGDAAFSAVSEMNLFPGKCYSKMVWSLESSL